MIVVLDYGIGNIASISNMLKRAAINAIVSHDTRIINEASKFILPGVGHFDYCMQQLRKASFFEKFTEKVLIEKVPVLGVCVGCQMFMQNSEEGNEPGLGWIKGSVIKFDETKLSSDLKIPNMNWTEVRVKNNCMLYKDINEPRFYFVHSYHLQCYDKNDITAIANHGYDFPASVAHGNILGVQFHPEKSHKYGMKLYSNFANNF